MVVLGLSRTLSTSTLNPPTMASFQNMCLFFPTYCGPPFNLLHPKAMPIVPVSVMCNKNCCCTHLFLPLTLSFGRTVHTYQGQNAGPVDPGRPPNPVQRIIYDPGTRSFEAKSIGLFYAILSRATTIGPFSSSSAASASAKAISSAIRASRSATGI